MNDVIFAEEVEERAEEKMRGRRKGCVVASPQRPLGENGSLNKGVRTRMFYLIIYLPSFYHRALFCCLISVLFLIQRMCKN